jgi:hypothetical protein
MPERKQLLSFLSAYLGANLRKQGNQLNSENEEFCYSYTYNITIINYRMSMLVNIHVYGPGLCDIYPGLHIREVYRLGHIQLK